MSFQNKQDSKDWKSRKSPGPELDSDEKQAGFSQ